MIIREIKALLDILNLTVCQIEVDGNRFDGVHGRFTIKI